ncbi:hypothetical protein H632_c1675p0 [Helicosporidium sp. ATCC 50920]|nr:hypothetical protein H632_c1675p0 [Helicosporidium sp. ATCC 50920]|eukprot:KDD73987.1 hypothetical protein H632_c1675p0 [Helicosporidium sp. ATCC 50920]
MVQAEVQQAKLLTLVKQGSEYIKAIDIKLRPLVAYVPHAKIARVARQTTLNKLAGEHLVLCGLYKQLDKEAVARDAAVRSEAFGHALAQELALFKSSQTTGGYQSRAPNISAIDWEPARPADTVLVVQPLQEEEEEERRKAAERAVAREKRKREEAEARKAKKPIVLEEEDLDWAGAGEEDDA